MCRNVAIVERGLEFVLSCFNEIDGITLVYSSILKS